MLLGTMRRWTLIAALFAVASFASAQSGTLELAVDSSPAGLDPHVVTAFASIAITGQIYDGLMEVNADLQLEPALATGYTVSDDGLTYTFSLREGVVFHNGRGMTADDVVYSYQRIVDVDTGWPVASRFAQVASVEALDAHTVEIVLTAPFAPFLQNTVFLTVVPREVVEETSGEAHGEA